ncbi:MAG TPA: phosphatase PAP2 family protein [Flavobacteriaceae bacterium]|nr:phosphatase PAP2 family protein [Flavobacteriaceae bacterium]
MKDTLYRWDTELLIWVNSFGRESTDSFWLVVTEIWIWFPMFLFIVYLFFRHLSRANAVIASSFFVATGVLTLFVKAITKYSFKRLRPCNVEELAVSLRVLLCKDSFSFFSGHASFSFAIITFTVLALQKEIKWVYIFYLWPVLFALSRMITGVHYPSDIIVGAGVGIVLGILTHSIYKKEWIKLPKFIEDKINF